VAKQSLHVIETAANGELKTTKRQVDKILDAVSTESKIVLHFHGGLVNATAGRRIARSLESTYTSAGAYPVFFVWHAGLLEVVQGNLKEIVREEAFSLLEKWVTKFALGKLLQQPGSRGLAISAPSDHVVALELARRRQGEEPFEDLEIPHTVTELDPQEEAEFVDMLESDGEAQAVTASIVDSVLPKDEVARSRGIEVARRRSEKTLMSPEVVAEFEREAAGEGAGQKGLLSAALLARKGAHVLLQVVQRFRHHNDHGLYPTVVEEILREFYLGNAGAHVWAAMKGETKDTFDEGTPARGGRYFMSGLGRLVQAGHRPEVTLVGHSTGAVFIDNLLRHVDEMRKDPSEALPADFRFKNVVFLAPACTFEDFASTVSGHAHLFDRFRMFTMKDEAERKDHLLSVAYPRSLLYFISGVLETEADGSSSRAKPLVGLNRYYGAATAAYSQALVAGRRFVEADKARVVWSPSSNGDGFAAGALHHGDFDDDPQVRSSLTYLISHD
jgi:hypothetical protein